MIMSCEKDEDPVEHIDLYNFEEPKFENSRYVLTSPRSLEACSRLNVKPVELLYKPLSEYQEELLPQDVPLRTIYNIYDDQEQIRKRKLQLCRDERSRISKDEVQSVPKDTSQMDVLKGKTVSIKGSIQRQRTAWSTGIGHKRLSKEELNHRVKELQEESVKLRHDLLSKKEGKLTKTVSRPKSAGATVKSVATETRTRSKSVSDIYNKLPAKDRKILDLMRKKREDERRRQKEVEHTRLLWEDEKQRQEALRIVLESKRRKLLAKENQIKDIKMSEESHRRNKAEKTLEDQTEQDILKHSQHDEQTLYRQLKMQELQLAEKKTKEQLQKSIQDHNRKMKEHDEKDMQKRVATYSKSTLLQAQQRRDLNLLQQTLRKAMSNHQELSAYEKRRREIEKDRRRRIKRSQSSIGLHHSRAEENLTNLLQTRSKQIISSHQEEDRKLERARLAQQKLEEEMMAWRNNLLEHKKQIEKQAALSAQQIKESRVQRIRQERMIHEQEQKKNLEKLLNAHNKWRKSLEESLLEKDKKVEGIQTQKEKSCMETRAVAQMSQMMRNKIRQKYETDTFDRKVLEAELFAKLETRPACRLSSVTNSIK